MLRARRDRRPPPGPVRDAAARWRRRACPGVIVPRKTVGELRKLLDESDGAVDIALSDTQIRFAFGDVVLTSKLIDGTFPDYERVIPTDNDKMLKVDVQGVRPGRRPRLHHLDREDARGEAGRRPRQGASRPPARRPAPPPRRSRSRYEAAPLEIGFNARYLLDIAEQIEGGGRASCGRCRLARPLVRDGADEQRALRPDADAGVTAPPISALAYSLRRRNRRSAGPSGRAPAPADRVPQLSPLRLDRGRAGGADRPPTARARPTSSRRSPSWRRAAACAGPASTRSPPSRSGGDAAAWAVAASSTRRMAGSRSAPAWSRPRTKAACRAGSCGSTAGRRTSQTRSACMSRPCG